MKKLVGLFTILTLACIVLSASPASAGYPYSWFNKYINVCGTYRKAPTTVTALMGTDVHWWIMIKVSLPSNWGEPIKNVVVTDRFGAEIEIDSPFPVSITHGTVSYTTKGNSEKVFLTWNIETLSPGKTAILRFKISTDHNPAGKQEYTSPGCYELNSGTVLKFTFKEKQYSAYTHPIYVKVKGYED